MKSILVSIVAAVVLVGCASEPEYSGSYSLTVEGTTIRFQLKSDGSFIGSPEGVNDDAVGTWKVEGDLLVCEGTTAKNSNQITVKFDKTTFKLISLAENGEEAPLDRMIPEGENGIYLRKSQQSAPSPESKPVEPVAEASQPKPPTAKAPDIDIWTAAVIGNIEAVKHHLAAGTDVNAKGEWGGTPLNNAAIGGQKEIAELLIAKGADVNAKGGMTGGTPLLIAVTLGNKEIAELLISKGADVNVSGNGGMTPLHGAAIDGHKEVAELLIAKSADVNVKKDDGETPLDTAIRRKHPEVADLLRKHGGKTAKLPDTPFTIHHAAEAGNIKAIKQHLVDGVDVNVKDARGMTPLHFATGWDHKESVELLIDADADVNAKDDEGRTPLDLAIRNSNWSHVRRKRTEIAALLRKHGGKTGEWLKAGESIHIAARVGHIEAVKHHLAAGTDVNAKDEDGKTPLDHAEAEWEGDVDEVNAARNEVADLLRKHGGKTTRPNISIHDAAGARGRRGNIEAVKQHLAAGTDVDARDKEDKTPLKHAAFRGYKEIVELLIAKGADVNAKDEDGRTALDWAHGETADLLRKHGGKTGDELKAEGK